MLKNKAYEVARNILLHLKRLPTETDDGERQMMVADIIHQSFHVGSGQQESGREITDDIALNLMRNCNDWLRSELARNPDKKCTCGSCYLCAYRHIEQRLRTDKTEPDKNPK